MDFTLTPEDETFREEVIDFIKNEWPRGVPEGQFGEDEEANKAQRERARAWGRKLAANGYLTMAWPKEYGGMEVSHVHQMIFREECGLRGVPSGSGAGGNGGGLSMLGPTLMIHGTDEQKKEYLPAIARDEVGWCQGYSEPEAGSDLASLQARAVEDGDDFVINGSKIWTSGAHTADKMFILVRTDPDAPKHRGISMLLIDDFRDNPGITIRPIINMANQHGFNAVFFDNVRVPKKNIVGEQNRGWYVGATLLDFERSGVGYSANARRNIGEMVQYAKETKRDGDALARNVMVRSRIAEMVVESEISRMLSYQIVDMQRRGVVPNKEASINKLYGSELGQRIARTGIEMLGLYGQLGRGDKWAPLSGRLMMSYLSTVSGTIAAGSSEIQRNVVATRGLGLPR